MSNHCDSNYDDDNGGTADVVGRDSYVNSEDGLNFYRASLLGDIGALEGDFSDEEMMLNLNDVSDLPSSLIVTNIPPIVFVNEESKADFENLLKQFDPDANFVYFKTFKRCRVNFRTPDAATMARVHCHQAQFKGGFIRCFFAQDDKKSPDVDCDNYLKLPALEKQFLISPPASPPVGWEQARESEPIVNFELLSRLASLATDNEERVHEIHSGNEDCPTIIVHTCDDGMDDDGDRILSMKLPQTRRPDFSAAAVDPRM